jgi:DNA-binding MarR family transcriptional regulator
VSVNLSKLTKVTYKELVLKLNALKKAVVYFREVYADMPLPMLLVFVEVAQSRGLTVGDVTNRVGISQAASSRHCRGLTKFAAPKKEGWDLCEWREDPNDFRSKLLYLNDKGEQLLQKLNAI